MVLGERLAAEALALAGVPFRLRGRDPATGLDCVGLVALAAARAGLSVGPLPDYALRGTDPAQATRALAAAGFDLATGMAAQGDLLLAQSGPMQLHLMIRAAGGLVHAHAGLGRVVLMPAPSPWPLLGQWRLRPLPRKD
jgi:cell wall-associated NlpC family hydrolase